MNKNLLSITHSFLGAPTVCNAIHTALLIGQSAPTRLHVIFTPLMSVLPSCLSSNHNSNGSANGALALTLLYQIDTTGHDGR